MLDKHIMGHYPNAGTLNTDSTARGRLARNGHKRIGNLQLRLKLDDS